MENRFLLACSCGRQLTIDPGQAGQVLTCACGEKLQAPGTLQELRRLPRALPPEADLAAPPETKWGSTPRTLFAAGLVLIVLGLLIAGYFGYQATLLGSTEKPDHTKLHSHINLDKLPPEAIDKLTPADIDHLPSSVVDRLSPSQVLDAWNEAAKGLPPPRTPFWVLLREALGQFIVFISVGLGAVVAGIAVCVAAGWMASSGEPAAKK